MRRLILLASVASLALVGCGQTPSAQEQNAPELSTQTTPQETSSVTDATTQAAEAEAEAQARAEAAAAQAEQASLEAGIAALSAPWEGPYGGVPRFDQVQIAAFEPALDAAMAEYLAEIDAIATNAEPATFENTIVAAERAGATLNRISPVYGVWSSNMSSAPFQEVEGRVAPKFAQMQAQIIANDAYFQRIKAVYEGEEFDSLDPVQQRLTWDAYTSFVRTGANLDEAGKARLSEINQRLARLFTNFSNNVLADEQDYVTYLTADELAGLPESQVIAAAAAATERGREGAYAILNTRSSMEPFLTYSDNREKREEVWRTYYNRGDNGDARDNNAIIAEILKLRAERATLLGYDTHAHWRLEPAMAKTPEAAMGLMEKVWPAAVERVREEVADMQAIADAEGAGITIAPWDYRYYMEKVRQERYDLDMNEVTPYMQLDNLRDAMFWMAGELFDFTFALVPEGSVPVFHPDVTVYEVTNKTTGDHVGLWYFDPYARTGKRSGAWMTSYRSQSTFDGRITTLVSNNSNFIEAPEGEATLISFDDANTLFHEFGHALHGLASNVRYPSQSGTAVSRDYVEFPSQILESWFTTPEILSRYALHHETGEPIPQELVDKIKQTEFFNQGFATVEYLASGLVDMKLHLAGDADIDPDAFERAALAELGMPDEIVMRHRTPQFSHVFASDGYSAGYYSYLWSDALTADAAEAFMEAPGGFYDKPTADRLVANVFAVGDTIDPAEGFRRFRGRDVDTSALMRSRGFPVTGAAE